MGVGDREVVRNRCRPLWHYDVNRSFAVEGGRLENVNESLFARGDPSLAGKTAPTTVVHASWVDRMQGTSGLGSRKLAPFPGVSVRAAVPQAPIAVDCQLTRRMFVWMTRRRWTPGGAEP